MANVLSLSIHFLYLCMVRSSTNCLGANEEYEATAPYKIYEPHKKNMTRPGVELGALAYWANMMSITPPSELERSSKCPLPKCRLHHEAKSFLQQNDFLDKARGSVRHLLEKSLLFLLLLLRYHANEIV